MAEKFELKCLRCDRPMYRMISSQTVPLELRFESVDAGDQDWHRIVFYGCPGCDHVEMRLSYKPKRMI